ncbi:helix-turn-helix transcriptional regulator [Vibrio litoralis]|uniref:helix-turn-helix transcriptional regulator n=1 Tax=Vibrio litoralis TaxID=335972 RepID=UPI001D051A65|nr:AlpA family transcriptional regulator [Vibrio litoralis]
MPNYQPSEIRLIRLKEVLNRTGLSKSTLYQLMKDGAFPRSISIGNRAVSWNILEVEQWINSRIAERDEVAA